MVGTRKDGESPLRSKKIVDAPQSRFLGLRILDVSIDDLAVSAVGAVNRRI